MGGALHKHLDSVYDVVEGDLVFFDASLWYEGFALEPSEWLGVRFYTNTTVLINKHILMQKYLSSQISQTND
jgi:hypothetical protein